MKEPQTIIELAFALDADQKDKVRKLIEVICDCDVIDVYKAKDYSNISEFSDTIYEEIGKLQADDCAEYLFGK